MNSSDAFFMSCNVNGYMIRYRKLECRKEFPRAAMNQKEQILEATICVFNKKGMKFTMDDLAKELNMSKKTIYKYFDNKNKLCLDMVDYCFDRIKLSEQEIVNNAELTIKEKIQRILGVLPDGYKDIEFRQLYLLKDKYPKIYKKVEQRLENGWDSTIALLNQGIEEGVVCNISIPIFKVMFESTIEHFFQRDVLLQNQMDYADALNEVVTILTNGIYKE